MCIDQADEERKAEQIGIMNFIYGGAWVTLVALCSLGLQPTAASQECAVDKPASAMITFLSPHSLKIRKKKDTTPQLY